MDEAQDATLPVSYLTTCPTVGILICTEHRTGYTLRNYLEHLNRAHGVKGNLKKRIMTWVESQNIAKEVASPSHYSAPLPGLQILSG